MHFGQQIDIRRACGSDDHKPNKLDTTPSCGLIDRSQNRTPLLEQNR